MPGAGKGRRRRYVAAGASLVLLFLTACGGTNYHFVSSTSTQTFVKVPSEWHVFSQSQILAHLDASDPTPKPRRQAPFFVIFDGDPAPSLNHDPSSAHYPFGLVRVRHLAPDEQDSYSLASLRNEVLNVDQLQQANASAVIAVQPPKLLTHSNLRGTRLEFAVRLPDGSNFTFDQVGFVDSPTRTVWLLFIGCATNCYRTNAATIHRVADSWIVKGK
jgi:hypothetical protein